MVEGGSANQLVQWLGADGLDRAGRQAVLDGLLAAQESAVVDTPLPTHLHGQNAVLCPTQRQRDLLVRNPRLHVIRAPSETPDDRQNSHARWIRGAGDAH